MKTQRNKNDLQTLLAEREPFLRRAFACAEHTFPRFFLRSHQNPPMRHQAHGSLLTNHLATQILHALFPPNRRFVSAEAKPSKTSDVIKIAHCVSSMERDLHEALNRSEFRRIVLDAILNLLIAGNALLILNEREDSMRVLSLRDYAISRNRKGIPDIVIAQTDSETVTIAKRVEKNKQSSWLEKQNGKTKIGETTYIPLSYLRHGNTTYGNAFVEQYLPELRLLEDLSKTLMDIAKHMSKNILMIHPEGVTDIGDIQRAENGSIVWGDARDLHVLRLSNPGNIDFISRHIETIKTNLSRCFLMHPGFFRDAERVTATEIEMVQKEINCHLGGHLFQLAQDIHVPLAMFCLKQSPFRKRLSFLKSQKAKIAIRSNLFRDETPSGLESEFKKFRETTSTFVPEHIAQNHVNWSALLFGIAQERGLSHVMHSKNQMCTETSEVSES